MKVAIITDQHFGFKKGSKLFHEYFQKFYEETFFPTLQERGIDTVLDLGDTFDNRKGIDLYSLDWSQKNWFNPLRDRNISLISIVGNHTAFYKNTNCVNTIDLLLREYSNIRIVVDPEEINVGGRDILFVPWITPENMDLTKEMIEKSKAKISMGHLELNGFYAHHGYCMDEGHDIEPFLKFDRVFSGHYHTRSNDGRIFYLGNPYELFWNDVGDKRGFHIFDTETLELEVINNPFTMYKVIKYDDTPRQLHNFSKYKQKIVKIIVKKKSNEKEYDKFMEALQFSNPYDIKIVEKIDPLLDFDDAIVDTTEDTMTLLDKYVDDLETNLHKPRIKNIVKKIYHEACEVM